MAHKYSLEEIEYLKKISYGKSNKEITEIFNKKFDLNLGEKAISSVRKKHNIKTGNNGQFQKGQISWNKGKKGYIGANKTSFQKGHTPKNHRPVGSERVCSKDGYLLIKVKEPNKWQPKHRVIWEEHNGPLPRGCVVIFGDRKKRNFSIDNLILVTRNQLKCLNQQSLIQKDADLTRAAITIVDLQNKISYRKKLKDC